MQTNTVRQRRGSPRDIDTSVLGRAHHHVARSDFVARVHELVHSMKSIVITRPGGAEGLAVEERPIPEPGPGEIRVRVQA